MSPPQILAIDDSPEIHQLLEARLRPDGVELHRALDAEDGLLKAAQVQPDLVLLDLDLAGTSGFDLCARLKADPRTAHLVVIFLTGTDEIASKVRAFDAGAVDYVTKPFDANELRARVRAALRTKRFQDLLTTRAQIDGLTGAYNRAFFDRKLIDECGRSRRNATSLAMVMCDLDHFKKLNDTHGHQFGDRVIQTFADILTREARNDDSVCRYGGEEFVILMPETVATGAAAYAERVRAKLEAVEFKVRGGERTKVTASFGISDDTFAAGRILTGTMLLASADAALYAAKHAGRNRVSLAEQP